MRYGMSTVAVGFFLVLGCQSGPAADDGSALSGEQEAPVEAEETIDQEGEKINDNNGLGVEEEGLGQGECPPPEDSGQVCAQMIVWALGPDGQCCQYPTPCHGPKDWESFATPEACAQAAEEMDDEAESGDDRGPVQGWD